MAIQRKLLGEIESRLSICDSIEKTVDTALQQAEALRHLVTRDDDAFYIVNYFKVLGTLNKDEYSQTIAQIKSTVSNWLDTTIDESIRQKYLYVEKQIRKYIKESTNA